MKSCTGLAFLGLVFASESDGAMNLKIFNDPKDVSLRKNPTSSCTTAKSCKRQGIEMFSEEGYLQSKNGEDRCLIEYYFPGVCGGKYLDIGAADGVQDSNTYALHKVLGWTGVNIEIDPDNYEKLERNRRKDIANVHAAVCSDSQIHYAVGQNKTAGGIWEFASEAHRERWWPGMTLYHTIPLKCTPLQSILDQTVGTDKYHFDLATIDVVGAELSVLLGIDFERMSFGLIIVERYDDMIVTQRITDLLHAKGYSEAQVQKRCGDRKWFIRNDFHSVYQRLKPYEF